MKKYRLSQESLKIIACVTMLIDHIGSVVIPAAYEINPSEILLNTYTVMRAVGRVAFPIYCFLLAEGAYYTRSRREYAKRLLIGLVLSEIPFDLLFFGEITLAHQSVMVTLLLGYLYAVAMNYMPAQGYWILLLLPFAMLAEVLHTDYGGWGVAMIGLFVITRESSHKYWMQVLGLGVIAWMIGGMTIPVGPVAVPIQVFSMVAMIPIARYDGSKRTNNIWVRRGFYLFYPVHLAILYLLVRL